MPDPVMAMRDVDSVAARVAAIRCAVPAVPADPDDPEAGAMLDWPDGAAASSDPPQAKAATDNSNSTAAAAKKRILASEFIMFLQSFLQIRDRLSPITAEATRRIGTAGDTMPKP